MHASRVTIVLNSQFSSSEERVDEPVSQLPWKVNCAADCSEEVEEPVHRKPSHTSSGQDQKSVHQLPPKASHASSEEVVNHRLYVLVTLRAVGLLYYFHASLIIA